MLGKSLKIVGKLFLCVLVLLLVYVSGVLLVNLRDKPPSATVIEFQQSWNNRTPVDADANGYFYFLGFDVAQGVDPKAIGEERVEWTKEAIHSTTEEFMSFPQPYNNFQKKLPKEIVRLIDICSQITTDCIESIDQQHELINQWSKNDGWIIDRYQQLIAHKAWLELVAADMRLPLPNYGDVMKVQRLTFIHAFARIEIEDNARITDLLDSDLRFWRTMLKDTDMLIGKMIAVAAIKNNFLWTNHFLLKVKKNSRSNVELDVINQPFTDEELSMRRCLIGEWFFAYSAVNPLDGSGINNLTGKTLIKFVYQKQDTLNMAAESLNSIVLELDKSLGNFETTLEHYQNKRHSEKSLTHYLRHPYNVVGQILSSVAPPTMYTDYVVRTKDLEAFRRGLLQTIAMHRGENADAYSSPYQTQPFVVNRKNRSVTVTGLGHNAHSQQIYFY